MKVIILISPNGDWEGLFIDGQLISEGHTLGQGDRLYLLKTAEEYDFKSDDVKVITICDEDEQYLMKYGAFPERIDILKGDY